MAQHEPIRKRTGGPSSSAPTREIPDKLYFRIGEVAKLCEVPAYVLRFWESEFPQLKPNKGGTGQRLFRRRDVEMALRIKALLYDEGYTIPGARAAFKAELRSTSKEPQLGFGVAVDQVDTKHLIALHKELLELHKLLSKPAAVKTGVQPIRRSFGQARPERRTENERRVEPFAFAKPQLLPSLRAEDASLFDDLPSPS